jgi:hypothetical protein
MPSMFDRRNSADLHDDVPVVTTKLQDSSLPSRTKIICTLGLSAHLQPCTIPALHYFGLLTSPILL